MDNKKFVGAVIVAVLFLVIAFAYNKNQTKIQIQDSRQDVIEQEATRPSETIDVKHQYKNGKHIFVGKVELPTPCHRLTSAVITKGDIHEVVLTTTATSEVCAQVITLKPFKLETSGAEKDEFIATLNGQVVNLNVFEIPASENIDAVEIYIKG